MASTWDSWTSFSGSRPKVGLTLPPGSFLRFPPSEIPKTLPPPSDHPTLAHPFTIPIDLYNAALSPNVPILAALGYVTTIHLLNGVNERRNFKPWAFSKTRFFKLMVITHNIILALYSAWTFVGMVNALRTSVYSPWEQYGLAGTVDSLCKMHGPRGPGSAAVFGESTSAWTITNRLFHLGADGLTPESTDVGRIWNQGLAFYGWLFYLSKFYEVIDTLIIIAKGKRSSFLQTYHHAGAMICMWAGIRYMSAPIWMFVLVNSFIHSIMYTFYLCSAIGVRVPVWFKKTLTTLQITQFVVGASYAFVHLFVKYESPISVPYTYHLGNVASAVAQDASAAASSVVSTVTAVATDDWPALLKKAALRAAGREGLAENVFNRKGQPFGIDAVKAAQNWAATEETRYRDELEWTHCLTTSGQTFAILLNVVYLLPLTWLFANFFIRSYLQRVERRRSSTASQKAQLARESARDAAKRSGRRLSQAFEDSQAGVEDTGDEIAVIDGQELKKSIKKGAGKVKKETSNAASAARDALNNGVSAIQEESGNVSSAARQKAEETIDSIKKLSSDAASKIQDETEPTVAEAKQGMASTLDDMKQQADTVKTKAQDFYQANLEGAKEGYERTKTAISSLVSGEGGSEPSDSTADRGDGKDVQSSETGQVGEEQAGGHDDSEAQGTPQTNQSSTAGINEDNTQDTDQKEDNDNSGGGGANGEISRSEQEPSPADEAEAAINEAVDEKPEDDPSLSPKEKVQEQDPSREVKAEANTGDAKEDDSPAEQPFENTSKEEHSKQDTNIQSSQGEDIASKEGSSEESTGTGTVGKAVRSAQDTVSDVADTVKKSAEDASSNTTFDGAVKKAQDSITHAQDIISKRLSGHYTGEAGDSGDVRDYDDQKESWIHVQHNSNDEQESQEKSQADDGPTLPDTDQDGVESTTETEQNARSNEDQGAPQSEETTNTESSATGAEEQGKTTPPADKSGSEDQPATSEPAESLSEAEHSQPEGQNDNNEAESTNSDSKDVVADTNETEQLLETESEKPAETGNSAEPPSGGIESATDATATEAQVTDRTESTSDSPEWFEKLTTGIDSPTSDKSRQQEAKKAADDESPQQDHQETATEASEKKQEDKSIDESQLVRDEIVDEKANESSEVGQAQESVSSDTKQEQDKTIDESEAVRDEPIEQDSSGKKPSDSTSEVKDTPDTSDAVDSTKEQDKIIDESEPVRDEIKDTDAPSTGSDENAAKSVEAGA